MVRDQKVACSNHVAPTRKKPDSLGNRAFLFLNELARIYINMILQTTLLTTFTDNTKSPTTLSDDEA
jgi:hypothetical protein